MTPKLLYTFILALCMAACGARIEERKVKEYRLGLAGGDVKLKPLLKALIADYNTQAGFQAMEFVESVDQANSMVYFTEGLEQRDGKVGWGQWLSETRKTGVNMPGYTIDETTVYTLKAEFDAGFFRSHGRLQGGALDMELRKLFAHEIGHGFQMEHHPDQTNVMYYDITGDKNFSQYWPRVQAFFSN